MVVTEVFASYDNKGELDQKTLIENLEKMPAEVTGLDEYKENLENEGSPIWPMEFQVDGYDVTVENSGNVTVTGSGETGGSGEETGPELGEGKITSIKVDDLTLAKGETATLAPTIKPSETDETLEFTVDSSGNSIIEVTQNGKTATVKGLQAGETSITVTGSKTKDVSTTCKVKVANIDVANVPKYWKVISSTDPEWYSYGDMNMNSPKLAGNMTPIVYTEDGLEGQNKWANAITSDGSMFVWIPRFAYRIPKNSHTSTASEIQIAFIDTENNFLNNSDKGTGKIETTPTSDTAGTTNWLVHPAFSSDATYGGGFGSPDNEISGIWVGKFEATGTSSNVSVKPGWSALTMMTINSQFKAAKNATFGETAQLNSHMAKNSEWGATAYLAHSKYGTDGKKVEQNTSSSYYTGGSGGYKQNETQSTTHNATGVYDMNGGAYEYVASYVNYFDGNFDNGESDLYDGGGSSQWKTVYDANSTNDKGQSYGLAQKMKGDAVYETSSDYTESTSWFFGESFIPEPSGPFFQRGNDWNSMDNSAFSFNACNGIDYRASSFRIILCP